MAGAELTGIGSLEEIFLSDTQNAAAATSDQKCDNTNEVNEQEDKASSDNSEPVQVYAIDMDISETMGTLKSRAAEALHLDLRDYSILVLSEKELGDDETLQKQCGTNSGLVQIQFVVGSETDTTAGVIDILDVLKPNEVEPTSVSKPQPISNAESRTNASELKTNKTSKTMRWIVCPTFKELQRVLKIPQDPHEWTPSHVRHWLSWAIYQFGMRGINVHSSCWSKTGRELFSLGQTEFQKLVPDDHEDIFYMHFELLRRTRVVAVVCDPNSDVPKPSPPKSNSSIAFIKSDASPGKNAEKSSRNTTSGEVSCSLSAANLCVTSLGTTSTGTPQIQLWQFLLELLTTPKMYPIISWYGEEGVFRLHQPEIVASLWGQRKSKPNMNYEKLSRALRYYYEGEMIAKVSGKRFVYRFVLDLKSVVGYSAEELKRQVEECHTREGYSPEFTQSLVVL